MPQGRMLRKNISYDPRVNQLSLSGRLLFTWCIPHLDVRGRILGSSAHIKGVVCPFVRELSAQQISKNFDRMRELGLVTIYAKDGHKYIQFNGFAKNQRVDEKKESPSYIPDPTPELLQSYSRETLPQVKQSKVKESKTEASPELRSATNKVFKKGFNIYQLINKYKKDSKLRVEIPEGVIIGVCEQYLKNGNNIRKDYPWFLRVLKVETEKHFAEQNIEENERYKKQSTEAIGNILKRMTHV